KRGVRFNEVVATHHADAEVDRRSRRVAVAARLVPPERVIVPLNSYPATRGCGSPVPDRHIAFDANLRRRRIDPNARHAVRRGRDALHPSANGRHEQNAVRRKALHDTWSTNSDIALSI